MLVKSVHEVHSQPWGARVSRGVRETLFYSVNASGMNAEMIRVKTDRLFMIALWCQDRLPEVDETR